MRKSLSVWQFAGFVFTAIVGVLLHFLFEWSGKSAFAALFSAVNESIFEHLKLLFFPMFIFSFIQKRFMKDDYKNFWCIKLIGAIIGITMIPVLYYTLNGILGTIPDWVNIAIFFIVDALVYIIENYLFDTIICKSPKTALFVLCFIALCFVVLTFNPPHIPFFEDPISHTYGYAS